MLLSTFLGPCTVSSPHYDFLFYQRDNFKRRENDLMVELATDLRKVIPQESVWLQTIKKYVNKHQEILVLFNMSTGSQTTWSLSDCLLFFYTFLTTFGE